VSPAKGILRKNSSGQLPRGVVGELPDPGREGQTASVLGPKVFTQETDTEKLYEPMLTLSRTGPNLRLIHLAI
jgi:hypothetical protein